MEGADAVAQQAEQREMAHPTAELLTQHLCLANHSPPIFTAVHSLKTPVLDTFLHSPRPADQAGLQKDLSNAKHILLLSLQVQHISKLGCPLLTQNSTSGGGIRRQFLTFSLICPQIYGS